MFKEKLTFSGPVRFEQLGQTAANPLLRNTRFCRESPSLVDRGQEAVDADSSPRP